MFSIDSVIGEETTSRLNVPHLKGVVGKPLGVRVPPSEPENNRGARVTPELPFFIFWCSAGTRTGFGRRRAGGKARLQERVSPKPRRKGRSRDRGGSGGGVPPSAPSQYSKGIRTATGLPFFYYLAVLLG